MFQLFLAFFSFVFSKFMLFLIGNFYALYLIFNRDKASQWRVLSAENLRSPLVLPVLMTKAPRWNTHAIIGTLGPFFVRESLAIDLQSLGKSSSSWIIVFYSFPSYKTITSLESNRTDSQAQWLTLKLNQGQYTIGLRYYNWQEDVILPTVKVDDNILAESQIIPRNVNDFYDYLINHKNWFYSSLHYYIFVILKFKKLFPNSFIKNEFLPVGATDTSFFYDYLLEGEALEVKTKGEIINNYDIYLTIYDRCSLPVFWDKITREHYISKSVEKDGYYLFRLRPKFTVFKEALGVNNNNFQVKRVEESNFSQ